eukprot:4602832-Prorocentrum_lima.AAC.1
MQQEAVQQTVAQPTTAPTMVNRNTGMNDDTTAGRIEAPVAMAQDRPPLDAAAAASTARTEPVDGRWRQIF